MRRRPLGPGAPLPPADARVVRGGPAGLGVPPADASGAVAATMALSRGSLRNRTAEFAAAVDAAVARRPPGGGAVGKGGTSSAALPGHPSHPPSSTRAARSPFTALAATASADITRTSTKLATLTRLASRTSLFDDPSAEIAALTLAIKADLARLHVTLTQLGELRGAAATPQAGLHSSSVVDGLKARLGSTASGFQTVLKLRTESLAAAEARRSRFQKSAPPSAPGGPRVGAPRSAAVLAGGGAGSVAIDLGGGSLGAASTGGAMEGGGGGGGGGAMRQQLVSRPTENAYAASRADAVRQVETTIVELGQIFNQLATMVSEQGEVVERIDANTEEVARNVSAGHGQLIEYYNSVASNRGLILKVFGVLFAFLILWVLMA